MMLSCTDTSESTLEMQQTQIILTLSMNLQDRENGGGEIKSVDVAASGDSCSPERYKALLQRHRGATRKVLPCLDTAR